MSSERPDDSASERDIGLGAGSLAELADTAQRRIVTAIVAAAAVVALAIYARPAPPRFQVIAADGQIVRIDTRSGTVIACENGRCFNVLRKGQRLVNHPKRELSSKGEAGRPQAAIAAPEKTPPAPR